jgi:EmrB/QacA subfamily drug resistance transporter
MGPGRGSHRRERASGERSDDPGAVDRVGDDCREAGLEAPGTEEIAVVPWPLMMPQRLRMRAERSDRYPWLVLTAALVGLFSVGFSITVLTIAIPTIAAELDTSESLLIWTITGPMLLGAIVTPAAGKLADVLGARRTYLISMALVAVFAALTAAAWSAPSLIVFRVLGAAVGAATGPASLAIINRLFPRERRAQALGYWSLVAAGGPVLGAIIGGPVVEVASWRWIYVAQVPLSLLTIAICAAIFPRTAGSAGSRFDAVGSLLLATGVASFLVALNRGPEAGWSNPFVVAGFVLGPLLLVGFARYERRTPHPLMPVRYFRRRNFAFPMVNQFLVNFAYMGGFFITPSLLQKVLGYGPAATSYISIARPLVFAVAGPVAGWVAVRKGYRLNGVAGGLFIAASMLVFVTVGIDDPTWVLVAALGLSGLGMGTTAPAMAAAIANAVDERDLGVVGGAQQMMSQVGVIAGIQILVTVQQSREAVVGAADSYALAYLVGAVAALLGVVAACFVAPRRRGAEAPAVDAPDAPVPAEPALATAS